MRFAARRRYQLRDGARRLGTALGPLLEKPPVRLSSETRLRIELCFFVGLTILNLAIWLVGLGW